MLSNNPEIEAKKKHIKMEMMLKDSDFKKNVRILTDFEAQMRMLKKKKAMVEVELAKIEADVKKIQGMQLMLQTEMKRLKNNLNTLQ